MPATKGRARLRPPQQVSVWSPSAERPESKAVATASSHRGTGAHTGPGSARRPAADCQGRASAPKIMESDAVADAINCLNGFLKRVARLAWRQIAAPWLMVTAYSPPGVMRTC